MDEKTKKNEKDDEKTFRFKHCHFFTQGKGLGLNLYRFFHISFFSLHFFFLRIFVLQLFL
jgi:hypothetical protein